jgi:hypothetical protein
MVLARLHYKMVTLTGGNSGIARWKAMEHMFGLMETDILARGCRVACTGMDFTDGQTELYIKDNTIKVKEKGMDIRVGLMAISIMESTRTVRRMEREFNKRKARYTESNMKMIS